MMSRHNQKVGKPGGSIARKSLIGCSVVALLALFVLWMSGFFSTPKEVIELRAFVDTEITELQKMERNEVPYSSRSASMGDMFNRMRDMPEHARGQARREIGRLFEARQRAELASYFGMPPSKRQAELDRRIKESLERRKAWEQERAQREASGQNNAGQRGGDRQQGGPGRGGPPGGGPPGGGRPGGGPGGGPPGGGQGGGGQGGGGNQGERTGPSDEQIAEWRKRRLDGSSPEVRAQSAEYRRAMRVRREELGIEEGPGRGRGRG